MTFSSSCHPELDSGSGKRFLAAIRFQSWGFDKNIFVPKVGLGNKTITTYLKLT